MLIAITAEGGSNDSRIEERFGRAKGFAIFDTENDTFAWRDNGQNLQAEQGAGIQAAKHVIESGAGALIASNVGPKAFKLLDASGVSIYRCPKECEHVGEAISRFNSGSIEKLTAANQDGHW